MRLTNDLEAMGVRTIGHLTRFTAQGLLARRGIGKSGVREIRRLLGARGLALRGD